MQFSPMMEFYLFLHVEEKKYNVVEVKIGDGVGPSLRK